MLMWHLEKQRERYWEEEFNSNQVVKDLNEMLISLANPFLSGLLSLPPSSLLNHTKLRGESTRKAEGSFTVSVVIYLFLNSKFLSVSVMTF